jgi:putative transposase
MLTPKMVHFGETAHVLAQRQAVLDAAYSAHPERFVRKPPATAAPPAEVWINPPIERKSEEKSH